MRNIVLILCVLSFSLFGSENKEKDFEFLDLGDVIIVDQTLVISIPFNSEYNEVFYYDTCSISINELKFNGKKIKRKKNLFNTLEEDASDIKHIKSQENINMYWEKFFDNEYYTFTFLDYFNNYKEYKYNLPMKPGKIEMSYRIVYPNGKLSDLFFVTWKMINN